jgi:hypothetical protein
MWCEEAIACAFPHTKSLLIRHFRDLQGHINLCKRRVSKLNFIIWRIGGNDVSTKNRFWDNRKTNFEKIYKIVSFFSSNLMFCLRNYYPFLEGKHSVFFLKNGEGAILKALYLWNKVSDWKIKNEAKNV